MAQGGELSTIRAAARRAELRMRIARALRALPAALTIALCACAVALAARKIAPERVAEVWARRVIFAAAATVALTELVALLGRLPPHAGALALDAHHQLRGRLANALAFAQKPPAERSPFMQAAIDDACRAATATGKLSARRAVGIALPAELGVSALVGLGLSGIALLEVRTIVPIERPKATASAPALELNDDDLGLFRDALHRFDQDDPDLKRAVDEFNQLIEDIAHKRLSREEAFRRMQQLDDELNKGAEEDRKELQDALKQMADPLEQSDLSKPAADALRNNDLAKAKESVKKLAEQLKDKHKPSAAEIERLRKALDRASKSNQAALDRLAEQRAESHASLLKAKQQAESQPKDQQERQKSLLKKKERELERLDRQIKRRQAAARKLSRLDRTLGKAAADLLRDLGLSAEDLQQLTEDLNRLEQDQMTDKEKEDLRKRLEELRELIRQQGQGGKTMRERLKRFMRRAQGERQGQRGKRGKGKGKGQPGEGDDGNLRPGHGQGDNGEGDEGDGDGKGGKLRLGAGGKSIPIEVPGGGGGEGDQPGGEGADEGGKQWGKGSAAKLGKASDIDGKTIDVHAEGLDDKKGPTNAEVIMGAAERGFSGKPYRKVYKDYHTVAEDHIDKEKIPDGMRFYVRRYFQLIRPRE